MPKVWCAAIDCIHNSGNQCRAKEINLRDGEHQTMYDGRQRFQQCRMLEQGEEIIRMLRMIRDKVGSARDDVK